MSTKKSVTYTVIGTRKLSGVAPGGTVKRDPDDPVTRRLLQRGRLTPVTIKKEQEDG